MSYTFKINELVLSNPIDIMFLHHYSYYVFLVEEYIMYKEQGTCVWIDFLSYNWYKMKAEKRMANVRKEQQNEVGGDSVVLHNCCRFGLASYFFWISFFSFFNKCTFFYMYMDIHTFTYQQHCSASALLYWNMAVWRWFKSLCSVKMSGFQTTLFSINNTILVCEQFIICAVVVILWRRMFTTEEATVYGVYKSVWSYSVKQIKKQHHCKKWWNL